MKKFNVIGNKKPIYDAIEKVTGQKQYTADIKLPGMLYGKILFSPVAHAKIRSISTEKAEALPGVHAVATWKNTSSVIYNSAKRFIENKVVCTEKIFDDTVRFVGDRVAAVAAETEEIANEAIKLIEVEYEPLPVVTTIEDAIKEDAYPIHGNSNQVGKLEAGEKELDEIFAACDHVIEGKYTTQPIHHAAIEPHTAIADYQRNNRLTVYSPNQNSFAFRVILAEIFDLSLNHVRVITPGIGGAFGGKLELTIEPVAAALSKLAGRPVKIVLTRKETITASRVRHASLSYVKTGFNKDGKIQAMDFKIYTNTGAYASSAFNVAGALTHKVFAAYKVKHMHIEAIPVYTNTIVAGAMRGYGSPQIYFGMQRQINEISKILGKNEVEIQRLNMVDPDSLNPVSQKPLGNPRPKDCLERAAKLLGYEEALARQEEGKSSDSPIVTGVGVALGVHGNNCFGAHRDNSSPMLKMNEDGSCIYMTGAHDMGTDTVGMQLQIVSEILGISLDKIDVVVADTHSCLWHIGDYSSRGVFVIGAAAKKVAEKMKKELQLEAAICLNTTPESIELGENAAWDVQNPEKRISLREVMIHCQSVSGRELCVYETYEAPRGAFSYGVHMAEVEINKQTGEVGIKKYVAVHDVGRVINPLMIEGQLEGAIQMGIGYALSENIQYDEAGIPGPLTLKKYGVRRITQMPEVLLTDFIETPEGEPEGPYGAKALGECPVVPAAPAIVNAICNALDQTINDLPVKKEQCKLL